MEGLRDTNCENKIISGLILHMENFRIRIMRPYESRVNLSFRNLNAGNTQYQRADIMCIGLKLVWGTLENANANLWHVIRKHVTWSHRWHFFLEPRAEFSLKHLFSWILLLLLHLKHVFYKSSQNMYTVRIISTNHYMSICFYSYSDLLIKSFVDWEEVSLTCSWSGLITLADRLNNFTSLCSFMCWSSDWR